jgi:ribosomal protein L3
MRDPEYRKKENARISKWAKDNRAHSNARARTGRLRRARAQPPWLTSIQKAQIQEFYEIATARGTQTGERHHVDHMFAVHGKGFSGLHVPWNLQVLTMQENDQKGRSVPPAFKQQIWGGA